MPPLPRPGLRSSILWIALTIVPAVGAARADEPARAGAEFSGDRAMEHLEAIVAIGPRVSGSPGMLRASA